MFERFTKAARQVVIFAQDEARRLRHDYIGTEHILIGLLRVEEGTAARALDALGVTADDVRSDIARLVGQGDGVATGQIPFTRRAKNVLELALLEAMTLGHHYIGTEHLLLGLARERNGVATVILLDLNVDAATIRYEVMDILCRPNFGDRPGDRLSAHTGRRRAAIGDTTIAPRFTSDVRRALALAQEEARTLRHVRMGTEHILLGLIREQQGLGARLLDGLGITLDDARAEVVRMAGRRQVTATGHIPFTPQADHALERARSEARALGHERVGTEHVLLGILREIDGRAARIIRECRRLPPSRRA
jgi:ATP-dependent Clp protease ATP-binding subunit ClpA